MFKKKRFKKKKKDILSEINFDNEENDDDENVITKLAIATKKIYKERKKMNRLKEKARKQKERD